MQGGLASLGVSSTCLIGDRSVEPAVGMHKFYALMMILCTHHIALLLPLSVHHVLCLFFQMRQFMRVINHEF